MNQLSNSSDLWKDINTELQRQKAISNEFILQCGNHEDVFTTVTAPEDIYIKSPEGGCSRHCSEVLPKCGHQCPRTCHILDQDHENVKCLQPCIKILCEFDHVCPKRCYEECEPCKVLMTKTLPCSHVHDLFCHLKPNDFLCTTAVERIIPNCEHKNLMPCFLKPEKWKCQTKCETRLDCGHMCKNTCHVNKDPNHEEYKCYSDCTRLNKGCNGNHRCRKKCFETCNQCNVPVKKVAPCGHEHNTIPCHEEEIICKKPCKRKLACGHWCKKKCSEQCGDCQVMVEKESTCGHQIKVNLCLFILFFFT